MSDDKLEPNIEPRFGDPCPKCGVEYNWRDLDMDSGELFCKWCGEVIDGPAK